jgi:methyl coenzyme M reductase subunit C-like uncharacterized protein (methanogenesis marker protein 7)
MCLYSVFAHEETKNNQIIGIYDTLDKAKIASASNFKKMIIETDSFYEPINITYRIYKNKLNESYENYHECIVLLNIDDIILNDLYKIGKSDRVAFIKEIENIIRNNFY